MPFNIKYRAILEAIWLLLSSFVYGVAVDRLLGRGSLRGLEHKDLV